MSASVDLVEFSQYNEDRLANPYNVVSQLVTSQPVTVETSWAEVESSRENSSHHLLCTAHLNTICVVPTLAELKEYDCRHGRWSR